METVFHFLDDSFGESLSKLNVNSPEFIRIYKRKIINVTDNLILLIKY